MCCQAACKTLPVIPEMCSFQELSSHFCLYRFFLSNTERILISRIPLSSQKCNPIPSNFTHFFLSLIPNRKLFQNMTHFHCGMWMSYRGQCCLSTGCPASNVTRLLMMYFSRICYFLSQTGIHCRNEFTLALCHLVLRTETLSLTFLRQTVMCYRKHVTQLLRSERRCLNEDGLIEAVFSK